MLSKEAFGKGVYMMTTFLKGVPSAIDEEKDKNFKKNRELLYGLVSHLEDEDFLRAVDQITREDKFFPTPSRIFEIAEGNKYKTAGEAWGMVRKKIVDDWKRDTDGFPPEVIKAVQCMGGMNALAERKWGEDNENEPFIKREFIDCYKDLLDAAKKDPKVMAIGSGKGKEATVSMKDGLKSINLDKK